jgi:hypothetical protein
MAMFRVKGDFDFEDFCNKVRKEEQTVSVRLDGGRPTLHGDSPGAQMSITLRGPLVRGQTQPKILNARILVSYKGIVQIFYETTEDFYECFFFLKHVFDCPAMLLDRLPLVLVDVDAFDLLVSCIELKQIGFVQDSCAMDLNREPVRGLMYLALINVLRNLFQEIDKTIDGIDSHGFFDSYQFVSSWVSRIQACFTDLLLFLKEDPEFARELLNSVFKWLDQLETKVKHLREVELQESDRIGSREEWIEWMRTNKIWSKLSL